ncbi:MAG: DNA polymerase III subunit alpha [Ignavibacteria bacterium]
MKEFVHLHNHSHYSLLDAICTIEGLVNAAVADKMRAVALTDHGVMFGTLEFYKKCKSSNIKPIVGFEAYVVQEGSRLDRTRSMINPSPTAEVVDKDLNKNQITQLSSNYAHLVLLAKNETGYRNLIKLNSIGHLEGYYYKPRIDLEVLNKYREGIIALSACVHGVISSYVVLGDIETAKKMTGIYKDIFGDDFYLEIQNHLTIESEKEVLLYLPKIAKDLGVKLVATNDVHYIKKEHAIAHNIYLHLMAKSSKNVSSQEILTNLRYGTDQIYFKSQKEMINLFKDFPEAIDSTIEISEKCNLELDLTRHYMPRFNIPEGDSSKTLDEYLEKLAFEGLKKRIPNANKEAIARLRYELDIIKKMNFSGYFLIVQDFINVAKKRGILVGPGRGSAAGSLVCYCLGITEINPLKYNLLFERFLNPERISMPDIDVDFQDDRRDEIIQYAKETYGENSVAQIITFNKLAARGVLKDVGRVLNFSFSEINELTKLIPMLFGKLKLLNECIGEVPEFKAYFESGTSEEKARKKSLFLYSSTLENLNKNASIHASGIVIAPSDVTDYVPLSLAKNEAKEPVYCTQYDMNQLEDAGLIKIDFLGLKELKVIKRTLDLVNKRYGIDLTTDKIDLTDKKTYELFASGNTIGVFQFSKNNMREYLAKLKPKDINDLAMMNALYRPGPMKLIPEVIEKRFGRKPITYMHPKMESVLKETYGTIVYQEQVMQIAREIAGFTMAQADNMRKAMGKKIKEKMAQVKQDFVTGAVKNGVNKKLAEEIFQLILSFADYGFNKSHAVAYSVLAFYTAYLKTHYPLEFLAVSMDTRKDDESELQLLAEECKKLKIKLLPPDINQSDVSFKIIYGDTKQTSGQIVYGLSALKHVGEKPAIKIVEERNKNGPYKSITDFLLRIDSSLVIKRTVESLILAGAFDSIEPNRKKLLVNLEQILNYVNKNKSFKVAREQNPLFVDNLQPAEMQVPNLQNVEDFSEIEKFKKEKEIIGFYLSGHPLEPHRKEVEKLVNFTFAEKSFAEEVDKLGTVRMCGVISNLEIKSSKKNNKFATFDLTDLYGTGNCIAFSSLYENKPYLFENDNIVVVEGKFTENGNSMKLLVEDIFSLQSFKENNIYGIIFDINEFHLNNDFVEKIYSLSLQYPGYSHVFFRLTRKGTTELLISKDIMIKPTAEFLKAAKQLVGEKNLILKQK